MGIDWSVLGGQAIPGDLTSIVNVPHYYEGVVEQVYTMLYKVDVRTTDGAILFGVIMPKCGGYILPAVGDKVVVEILPLSGTKILKYIMPEEVTYDAEAEENESGKGRASSLNKKLGGNNILSKGKKGELESEVRKRLSADPYNNVIRGEGIKTEKGSTRLDRLPILPENSVVIFDSPGGSHMHVTDIGDVVLAISNLNQMKWIRNKDTFIQSFRRSKGEWTGGKWLYTDEKADQEDREQDVELEVYTSTNNKDKVYFRLQYGKNTDATDDDAVFLLEMYDSDSSKSVPKNEEAEERLRYDKIMKKDGSFTETYYTEQDKKERMVTELDFQGQTYTLTINDDGGTEKLTLNIDLSSGEITLETKAALNVKSGGETNFESGAAFNVKAGGDFNVEASNTNIQGGVITLDGQVRMT